MRNEQIIICLSAVAIALILTGCGGDGGDVSPNASNNTSLELPRLPDGSVDVDAVKEASDASQCVKTTIGPCPCNAGGTPIAVNKKYASLLEDEFDQEGTACPQVYLCVDADPILVNGACALPNATQ